MISDETVSSAPMSLAISDSDIAALAVLDEVTRARGASSQFFIAINVLTVICNFAGCLFCLSTLNNEPMRLIGIVMSTTLFSASFLICFYWMHSDREFLIQHDTRFRALMDRERIYSDSGILSKTWDRIGNYRGRSSPVFYNGLSRYIPIVFIAINLIPVAFMTTVPKILAHEALLSVPQPIVEQPVMSSPKRHN